MSIPILCVMSEKKLLEICMKINKKLRRLGVISLYFMKRFFDHENTKVGKHEKFLGFFRVFVISCFPDWIFYGTGLPGLG